MVGTIVFWTALRIFHSHTEHIAAGLIFTIKIPTSTVFRPPLYFEITRQGFFMLLPATVDLYYIRLFSLYMLYWLLVVDLVIVLNYS